MTTEREKNISDGEIITDLLSLSGQDALEALHDMVKNHVPTKIGDLTLKNLMSVGIDKVSREVIASAVTETEQSVRFSFSPNSKPPINAKILIIGPDRTK